MKHILGVIALLLAVLTLMTACTTPSTPPEVTTDSTETTDSSTTESTTDPEEAPRETYEDLSHNLPEIKGADGKSSTVVAEGELVAPNVTLVFNGESGVFASPPPWPRSSTIPTPARGAAT